jgi:hypothetical protein
MPTGRVSGTAAKSPRSCADRINIPRATTAIVGLLAYVVGEPINVSARFDFIVAGRVTKVGVRQEPTSLADRLHLQDFHRFPATFSASGSTQIVSKNSFFGP